MKTIEKQSVYQYEIKKSKFITLVYPLFHLEDVNVFLNQAKTVYKDATHYCYAYKLGNIQKFSDDNEPNGTAGLPIMEVLNKNDLNYILCIVVRYFGGIKLGSGGLVRAYSKAVRDALLENKIVELVNGYLIKVETNYENMKQYDYLFKDKIIKKEFHDQIIYEIEISKDEINLLSPIPYEIVEERWITNHQKNK